MPLRRLALIALTAALSLPTIASGPRRSPSSESVPAYVEAPELLQIRRDGNDRFRAADYLAAVRLYQTGAAEAQRRGDSRSAIRFLNNLGSADYLLLRYRDAVKAYLHARALASPSDGEPWAALAFNLSSLYLQLGELDAAKESANRGLETPPASSARFRPKLLIQLAQIAVREERCGPAEQWLFEAIDVARDQLDASAEAEAWNELGNSRMDCGRVSEAEDPLLESYRLRKLARDPRLSYSYESLAQLRLHQNEPRAAIALLDLAMQDAAPLGPVALWRPLYARGRARRELGRLDEAYADLGESLRQLRKWRSQVLPADAFRVSSEVEIHRVYSEFVDAAAALYDRTRQLRYAAAAFDAAEESRAASLRALWAGSDRSAQFGDDYWRTVGLLRVAEREQLRGGPDTEVRRLRAGLAEMEAAAGLDDSAAPPPGDNSRPVARARLDDDDVYLAFHTGEARSTLWTLTRGGMNLTYAPGEAALRRDIAAFVQAIQEHRPDAARLGAALYDCLFGSVSPPVLRKTRWTIAADGPLFDLPFAALQEDGRYLIERHSIRMVTALAALSGSGRQPANGGFVGLGDPVYNRADPRLPAAGRPSAPAALLELPRLLGSGREVERCAAVWSSNGRHTELLEGTEATREKLAWAIAHNPGVVHVATHMLFPKETVGRGMLALSLRDRNTAEYLSDTDVAGMTARVGLVVLNGCSSGRGPVLPGSGLMGMTRAWLAAGAGSVISTRWPAPDQDAGTLFAELYRLHFERGTAGGRPAWSELLRDAQLAELRAGGARALPAAWASYFCVERN